MEECAGACEHAMPIQEMPHGQSEAASQKGNVLIISDAAMFHNNFITAKTIIAPCESAPGIPGGAACVMLPCSSADGGSSARPNRIFALCALCFVLKKTMVFPPLHHASSSVLGLGPKSTNNLDISRQPEQANCRQ